MSKRLVKIAKELNVGTATIVEHLHKSGFEIENKPTAKVTDEMYSELLKEFSKSIAIKEKADQLVIGTRPQAKKETPAVAFKTEAPAPPVNTTAVQSEPTTPVTPPPAPEPPQAPVEEIKEPVVEEVAAPEVVAEEPKEEPSSKVPGLKVLGKIDLDKPKPPKNKEVEEKKVEEPAPAPQEEEVKESPKSEVIEEIAPKAEEPAPEVVVEKESKPAEEPAEVTASKEVEVPGEAEAKKAVVTEPKPEPVKEEAPAVEAKKPTKQVPPKDKTPKPSEPSKETEAPSTMKDSPEVVAESPAPDASDSNTMHRAATPELRGLKILGKIDTDKLKKPKKKKKEKEKEKPKARTDQKGADGNKKPASGGSGQGGGSSSGDGDQPKRRKRKRRVVSTSSGGGNRGGGQQGGNRRGGPGNRRGPQGNRRGNQQEVKEVSKKEIEEKIKATMARISGGGKKKRQKMRRDNRERLRERQEMREAETKTDKLQLTEFISVSELASLMDVPPTDVIMACMSLGVIVSINQRLDAEVIELVAAEFNHEVEFISIEEQDDDEVEIIDDPEDLKPRAPIVTVMGHVDHGKTSLLDYIREANVAGGEAGGITQHIGAYEVKVGEEQKRITFLDTPGHEAFTAMRARGAKVTDIAIVIVAADDSIMPQTREAISHSQAADVPIIFAINKIDKAGSQPEKIKQELASMNFLVEEWGGQFQSQDISAKTGQNIDELLEKVLLEAELLELQANPDRGAIGTVLEASLDKGRGYVTKTLVQTGTLKIGDSMVAGEHSGKVKAMFNERGKRVKIAGPSTPVLVLGLSGAPQAGERFKIVPSEQEARQIASKRAQIIREQTTRATKRVSLDEIGRRLALGTFKELNLIVKGDFDGSVEALSDSLIKLSQETVQVNVIHKAVGQIIESDVLLASASDAIIVGFQVRPSLGARKLAEREGVQIKTYSIIYEAIEEIKLAIEGMLEPTKEEKIMGQVAVREVFKISKVGTVAGCYVEEGKIARNSNIRLVRNGIVTYPTREGVVGEIASLKRFKEDVKDVRNGMECGISIKNFNDIKVGDVIEAYEIVEIKQRLKE
ncbi:MAG: translation initiation factor IF-2 [Saprospiraceae bacterium]|nr:translation initiation factor IF-2 [Saprospiraceae bacterium]